MVITKPSVASTRLLGLGLKLYPSKMLHMLNKDLTQFMQSLSWVLQNQATKHKGSDGRVLEKKLQKMFICSMCLYIDTW